MLIKKKGLFIIALIIFLLSIEAIAYASTTWQYKSKPTIYSRSSWNARTPGSMSSRGTGYYLIFHHTARNFSSTNYTTCANEIRAIQDDHMDNNNWSDIGYHYLIDPAGRIWQGRLDSYIGSHTLSYNDNIGIASLGDYEGLWGIGAQTFPYSTVFPAMASLSAWLAYRDSLDQPIAYCHKDFTDTACPGRNMEFIVWDDLRGWLGDNMVEQ